MRKTIAMICAAALALAFAAGCATEALPSPEYVELHQENAELRERVSQLESWRDNYLEWFGDPLYGHATCGLTMIEITENEQGELTLVIQYCRIANNLGFTANARTATEWDLAEGMGQYIISLSNVIATNVIGSNSLFSALFPWIEVHMLDRVPQQLEIANIRFFLNPLQSRVYEIIISSDVQMSIDENRADMDSLPRCSWRDLPYFPNAGGVLDNHRFEIPIWVGEKP